jgi:hypothetical protein
MADLLDMLAVNTVAVEQVPGFVCANQGASAGPV